MFEEVTSTSVVSQKKPPLVNGKGWCDEFETGLNIIIAVVQKV